MSELYTVSYLQRINKTVRAESGLEAVAVACPWWNAAMMPFDGNVMLGVVKGTSPLVVAPGPAEGPAGKPPTGPTPGTPTLDTAQALEVRAA